MLATRVIPTILTKGAHMVKGKCFASDRVVGATLQAMRVHGRRGVDELVLLDVTATLENREPDYALVAKITDELFAPLTVGGGVRKIEHFRELLNAGADKISISTAAIETPELIDQAAGKFGNQAVVVSIDVKDNLVTSRCGRLITERDPVRWAKECVDRGAGEILLNNVNRDGTMVGYDLDLIWRVSEAVSVPVVASGGAGTYEHLYQGIQAGASAVAAGAMYQFSDATPKGASQYLANKGIEVRL